MRLCINGYFVYIHVCVYTRVCVGVVCVCVFACVRVGQKTELVFLLLLKIRDI